MFDLGSLLQGGAQLTDAIGSLILGGQTSQIEQDNLQLQKDTLDYQKGIQAQIFDREDTAIQRRVADLKRAGLSPVLAAGQAARAGSTVPVSAPQRGTTGKQMQSESMSAMRDLGMTLEQMKLIRSQQQKTSNEADLASAQADRIRKLTDPEYDMIIAQEKRLMTLLPEEINKIKSEIRQIDSNTLVNNAQIGYIHAQKATQTTIARLNTANARYLEKSMSSRVNLIANQAKKAGIEVSEQQLRTAMTKIDKTLYDRLYSFILRKSKEAGFLYSPATIDLMTANSIRRMKWHEVDQFEKDKDWYKTHNLPYGGRGWNTFGAIVSAMEKVLGKGDGGSTANSKSMLLFDPFMESDGLQ